MDTTRIRLRGVGAGRTEAPAEKQRVTDDFRTFFERAVQRQGIKFSKHARQRIVSRGISLNDGDISRIAEAVKTLEEKGGSTSLLFLGGTTFLTNVKQKTIITALDNESEGGKVFTQIDSAVFVNKS